MKRLFFILLLANLGMFILIYPQKAEKKVDTGLPDVGELYLYEELKELKADAGLGQETALAGNYEPGTGPAQESTGGLTDAEQGDQATSGGSSVEAQMPTEPERQLPVAASDAVDEPAPVEAPVCRTAGYLESRSDAEIVSVSLRALGLKPDLESETRNEQAGFWVLIPPQASRRQAINISNRLERDGVKDMWRFTSGDLVHAISLGLFRNEERAVARKREIGGLGYEVIIKPRYRQKTKYWLYFQEATPSVEDKEGWSELLIKFPDLELKETECR